MCKHRQISILIIGRETHKGKCLDCGKNLELSVKRFRYKWKLMDADNSGIWVLPKELFVFR